MNNTTNKFAVVERPAIIKLIPAQVRILRRAGYTAWAEKVDGVEYIHTNAPGSQLIIGLRVYN